MDRAVELLSAGGVIGLPTETVYGLASSIDSASGIEQIFALKKRPFFDPLIVHISHIDSLSKLTPKHSDALVRLLASKFWPGPLTMVLPKLEEVNSLICSGLKTVGIRMPNHPAALAIIEKLGTPVAAPSANIFSKTSPTTADHVRESFSNDSVFVVDGGPAEVGIESTVIRPSFGSDVKLIEILRPGAISKSALQNVVGENYLIKFVEALASPGNVKHHYMPEIPLVIHQQELDGFSSDLAQLQERLKKEVLKIHRLDLSRDGVIAARQLYQRLRDGSNSGADLISFKLPPDLDETWDAIYDRLKRAATFDFTSS